MRETKNPSQLVVGRAQSVADDNERCRRFASVSKNVSRRFFYAIGNSKPYSTQQISGSIKHLEVICAPSTFVYLTLCALRT